MAETLERLLDVDRADCSFTCDRCGGMFGEIKCKSCQALQRAFEHAPRGRDWPAWAREQTCSENARRLLTALAARVSPQGFVNDSLYHLALDAGLPRFDGELWETSRLEAHELELARWAWTVLRELIERRLCEATVPDLATPNNVTWVILTDPTAERWWAESYRA